MNPGNVGAVFFFEWQRALTPARMAWWLVLTLFPVMIITFIRLIFLDHTPPGDPGPPPPWSLFLYGLIPMLVSMLGALLWTSSAVSSELESQSWIYLAVRPHGKTALLLGKYLAAVTWILSAALLGLSICVFIIQPEDPWHLWGTIAKLASISCPAYAALYLALGVLFPQRAMAIAVAYSLVFELVVASVPALINTLTVQYRLRALLVDWGDIQFDGRYASEFIALLGNAPAKHHVAILSGYTVGLLVLAVVVVHFRELTSTTAADG